MRPDVGPHEFTLRLRGDRIPRCPRTVADYLLGAMAACVKLDVFGKRMLVEWFDGAWRTYLLGAEGKRSPIHVPIPEWVTEDELAQYFDDLYHESATPQRPAVLRLDKRA